MMQKLRTTIARLIDPESFRKLALSLTRFKEDQEYIGKLAKKLLKKYEEHDERKAREIASQRIAVILSKMDPLEPLLKEYFGVFSEQYEHPEERLNERGQLSMMMMGFQLMDDPSFEYMCRYVMDNAGNDIIKATNPSMERLTYSRAQIATMLLVKKEVKRLGELYKQRIKKTDPEDFDEHITNDT